MARFKWGDKVRWNGQVWNVGARYDPYMGDPIYQLMEPPETWLTKPVEDIPAISFIPMVSEGELEEISGEF